MKTAFIFAAVSAGYAFVPTTLYAQSLNDLACAAEVHCHGSALSPSDVRLVLDINSKSEAQQAFVDATRDFPNEVWRCAAAGECKGALTQNEARVMIPLPDEALAPAEAARSQAGTKANASTDAANTRSPNSSAAASPSGIEVEVNQPGATDIPLGSPQGAPSRSRIDVEVNQPGATDINMEPPKGSRPRSGIEVEVHKPGAKSIDLDTARKVPPNGSEVRPPGAERHAAPGEIQPEDGVWHFAYGRTRESGQCFPGLAAKIAKEIPAPMSGHATFQRPFNVSQIIPNPEVQWTRIAPNHWRGTLAASVGTAMQMTWDIRVSSRTRMLGDVVLRVSVPSLCTISTPFTFERQ